MPYIFRISTLGVGLALVLTLASFTACDQPQSEIAFTIPEPDLIPEGIAYDPTTQTFYVSSTYKRKIVSRDSLGTIRDFTQPAQDSIWGVVGMQVDAIRRHLWAATSHTGPGMPMQAMNPEQEGRSAVFKYDLETGSLLKKYLLSPSPAHPDGHFLNDLALNRQGDVFITDSRTRAVYTISHQRDSLEVFLPLERSPNGITLSADERYLFVALRGDVGRITVANREFAWLRKPADVDVDADGLYYYQNALLAVEPYDTLGVINRYGLSADLSTIEDHAILERDHPLLVQPTTGVVVGDHLYYIANSQLQVFRRLYEAEGETYQSSQLAEVVVLRVGID